MAPPHSLSRWCGGDGRCHRFAAVSLAGAADAAVSSSRWRWCLSWVVSVRKGGLSQWLCSLGLVGGGVVRGSGPPLALPPLPHQVINHNPPRAAALTPRQRGRFFFSFGPSVVGGGRPLFACGLHCSGAFCRLSGMGSVKVWALLWGLQAWEKLGRGAKSQP